MMLAGAVAIAARAQPSGKGGNILSRKTNLPVVSLRPTIGHLLLKM